MPLKFHRLFAIAGLVTCSLAIVTTSAVAQERRVFARDEVWQANFRDRIREKIDERRANKQRVPVEARRPHPHQRLQACTRLQLAVFNGLIF